MLLFEVSSSPVDVPQIKYGCIVEKAPKADSWSWLNVSSPIFKCSEKVYLHFLSILHAYILDLEKCMFENVCLIVAD